MVFVFNTTSRYLIYVFGAMDVWGFLLGDGVGCIQGMGGGRDVR